MFRIPGGEGETPEGGWGRCCCSGQEVNLRKKGGGAAGVRGKGDLHAKIIILKLKDLSPLKNNSRLHLEVLKPSRLFETRRIYHDQNLSYLFNLCLSRIIGIKEEVKGSYLFNLYLSRIMLMEEEVKKSDENLAGTITKLAVTSKDADNILKKVRISFLVPCLLFLFPCFLVPVSCVLFPFSYLLSRVSCLLSPVPCLLSPVSHVLLCPVSCLLSPVLILLKNDRKIYPHLLETFKQFPSIPECRIQKI